MPRRPKPRWWAERRQWYAAIGPPDAKGRATEVYFPREMSPGVPATDRDETWAHAELARLMLDRGAVVVSSRDPVLRGLVEAYLAWAESRALEKKIVPGQYRALKSHLGALVAFRPGGLAPLGDRLARSLTADDMAQFVDGMKAHGYSASYIDGMIRSAMAALNWAARPGVDRPPMLARNPLKGGPDPFRRPVVPRMPERFAETAVAAAWLRWLRRWARRHAPTSKARTYDRMSVLLIRCLIRTGARPGELCALRWSDLKWDGGVDPTGHAYAKATIPPDRWKSGAKTGRPRTIYFSPSLTRALRRLRSAPLAHPTYVFVHGRGRGGTGAGQPWADGSAFSKKALAARKDAVAEAVRIAEANRSRPPGDAIPLRGLDLLLHRGPNRVVNYLWRHTAASKLIMMGVDLATVAELLGTSVAMLNQHYGHLLDAHLAKAAGKLTRRA